MGPIALFDKSFLQALSVPESVWFDHYFYPNICPLFYVETLADLEKELKAGRRSEHEVAALAEKTPEMHGGPNVFHGELVAASLMGYEVPMNHRIVVAGGRPVRSRGKSGVVYETSPEAKAFSRWQAGRFMEVEWQFARVWRDAVNGIDLAAGARHLRAMGITSKSCKTLKDAKDLADAVVCGQSNRLERMSLGFALLGVPTKVQRGILDRWRKSGCPPFHEFAPYAAHVATVDLFFHFSLAAGLIGEERRSNKVDMAYLYYLPFCAVFISRDKLHQRCAPLFLTPEQDFTWGDDLKGALKEINAHFSSLSEVEKENGVMRFASLPPNMSNDTVTRLWDRHFPGWRKVRDVQPSLDDVEKTRGLVDQMNELSSSPGLRPEDVDFDVRDPESMSIQRMVRARKGGWWQVPKSVAESSRGQ